MFTWALLSQIQCKKHRLIRGRNVGSPTFVVCISFVMAPKSRYLESVNHKVVMWNTNRPKRWYFTIFFHLLFLYFQIFSLNCVCCHMFSVENFSVFMYPQLYLFPCTELILNHIYSPQIPAKNQKIVLGIT